MVDTATRLSLLDRVRTSASGAAWEEFADVYDNVIRGWLMAHGVPEQDADDVRQDVMIAVCQEIRNFEHNGRTGAFRTWLRRITANRLRQHWSRKSRDQARKGPDLTQLADQLADDSSRLTLIWEKRHDEQVLRHLLRKLAGRFEGKTIAAFRSIVLQEQPAREVAQRLGMTLGAVRVAQHRVLRALQELGQGLLE
ncbi:MAG: sigma-70 family RNA polymerase sigma factor [Planctomycetales bacterium]|nr:sigma-70 family RNA polymerase sigma factor [Planctomycetales bacterium]